jgi:hypothetical protein
MVMTHSHLTQWIEDADARQYCESARWQLAPTTYSLHLGETILAMPARMHAVAVQALSYMLHLHARADLSCRAPLQTTCSSQE